MSTGSITDALSRVSAIEQQLAQLQSGTLLSSALGGSTGASSTATTSVSPSTDSSNGTSSTDFANALAQAEGGAATSATGSADAATTNSDSALLSELLSAASGSGSGGVPAAAPVSSTAGATLPAVASSELTTDQQQFASTLSAQTGLSPSVVSAWLLSEESGGAAQSRQAQGNNDWLNIGYTDSATYGSGDSVWSDPTSAATATAQWLAGQDSIPGYGTASPGVQSILQSVGQTPATQIQSIQDSGWSSSGYPSLGSLYNQISGN